MTEDIFLAKLAAIEQALRRIRKVTEGNPDSIDDIDIQDIVVLHLQRAIQSAIDLAARVISSQQLGLPDTMKAHFTLLKDEGVITPELCEKLEAMVGFRNIAVHQYQVLDIGIIKAIISHRLEDIEDFMGVIKRYLRQGEA